MSIIVDMTVPIIGILVGRSCMNSKYNNSRHTSRSSNYICYNSLHNSKQNKYNSR